MKTITINYDYNKSIEVEVPRKKRHGNSLTECLISGQYSTFTVKVVKGLDEFVKHVVKIANDKSSNGGRWYAHCNGYCLDAIVNYESKKTGKIQINTYYNHRKSSI
jgi:hypothetical protein